MEVAHLDDQCPESNGATLRMPFSPSEVGDLTVRDGNPLAVAGSNPAAALEANKELTKPRHVRTDLAAGINLNDVDVRVAVSGR